MFRDETTFNIDPLFSNSQKRIVVEVLRRIGNHPELAAAFKSVLDKNVVINIHPVTRSDQIQDNLGGTYGLNGDNTISPGARIDIYVSTFAHGAPISLFGIAITVVHELIHALGVPAFSNRLDAPGSTWDKDVTKDLFRDYTFSSDDTDSAIGLAYAVAAPETGGAVLSSSNGSVFVGSDQSDTLVATGTGNLFFPGSGNNEIKVAVGGNMDIIKSGGGTLTVTLPSGIGMSGVSVTRSSDGETQAIVVGGRPEVSIENVKFSGAHVYIKTDSQVIPLSGLPSAVSSLEDEYDIHIDYSGGFYGGSLGSVSTVFAGTPPRTFSLASVDGDFSSERWSVDRDTGVISAYFQKPDVNGSQFTFLTVVVGDGVTSANIDVTIRWAYSNEYDPTL